MEGDDVLAVDLDLLLLGNAEDARLKRSEAAKVKLSIPGPFHVLGGKLVAPVALDPLAQREPAYHSVRTDLPFLGKLALEGQVIRSVGVDGDVLAQCLGSVVVGHLLVFEKIVVK